MIKPSKYPTEEFKCEAVRLLENSGKFVPKLAKELGISDKFHVRPSCRPNNAPYTDYRV